MAAPRLSSVQMLGMLLVYAFVIFLILSAILSHAKKGQSKGGLVATSSTETEVPSEIPEVIRDPSPPCPAMPRPAIVVLCYNRPKFLARTMRSLLSLPRVKHYPLYISQDGGDSATRDMAISFQEEHSTLITYWQKERGPVDPALPKVPSWGFVAQHYKWALDRLFGAQGHSHVIIVEDDMEFSVDFLVLFEKTAWLLDADPTLMCVSSWNDNSRGKLDSDPILLMRSSYFPGLGWMLKRETYLELLQPGWPTMSHWDNWLRANVEDRDCVVPSQPRNRNFGNVGASMNQLAFSKELAEMHFYSGREPAAFGDVSYLLRPRYVALLQALVSRALRLDRPEAAGPPGHAYLLLHSDGPSFAALASHFRIWTHPRSHFAGLQLVSQAGRIFLLADVRRCPLLPSHLRLLPPPLHPIAASQGFDCNAACSSRGMSCSASDMQWINSCSMLKQFFPCERGCILETGPDIPSYVTGDMPSKGYCVIKAATEILLCTGLHLGTSRLCACTENTQSA